jgi:hypothetical protein
MNTVTLCIPDDTRLERERERDRQIDRERKESCGKGSGLSKGFLGVLLSDLVVLPDI